MYRSPWARVVVALLVVGIAVGIGWRLYDVGYDHGVTHQIEASANANPGGASTVIVHDYDRGHGFFPFFLIFPVGFFILFFVVRPLAWGGRRGPGGMRRGLEDWHRQQHEKDGESRQP